MDEFLIHGCEQVLRFTRAKQWEDLTEERKVQLGFNLGVVAHGLDLTKEESYQALTDAREGRITMHALRAHFIAIIDARRVVVDEAKIARPF